MTETHLAVFRGKKIRRILHNNEWWFSIVDIVEELTGTERPRKYWSDLKKKLYEEGYDELSEKIGQLKMQSPDGKYYETDCAKGFHESKHAARKGGEVAGKARKDLEKKTGKKVVSSENYLTKPESRKRLDRK